MFLAHPTQVVSGTTTGKLVLWDCKSYREKLEMNRKQQLKQLDYSRQPTKIGESKDLARNRTKSPANRELTRDTLKSSGSTRSGTLSSRKSSAKTSQQDDDENNQQQISFSEQLLESGWFLSYFFFFNLKKNSLRTKFQRSLWSFANEQTAIKIMRTTEEANHCFNHNRRVRQRIELISNFSLFQFSV